MVMLKERRESEQKNTNLKLKSFLHIISVEVSQVGLRNVECDKREESGL